MRYIKPAIETVSKAKSTIKGNPSDKNNFPIPDSNPMPGALYSAVGAYEADE
jgi:hypothetical protein